LVKTKSKRSSARTATHSKALRYKALDFSPVPNVHGNARSVDCMLMIISEIINMSPYHSKP
jgi:hypothetical protein